jgi:4-amino-4-deoxy-L-arabinose transferase-like glycosyltransferase
MVHHPLSPDIPRNRPLYFSLWFLVNSLIAYSSLPGVWKWVLGLFGIFLPLYVACRTLSASSRREVPAYLKELKFSPPAWMLLSGIGLLVFLRFFQVETFPRWPNLDEGWNGILALELSRHWSWKFFYTFGDAPPLPIWCAAGLLKLGFSPSLSLWFPSAAVSLLTVFVGFWTARLYFSKSFAWVGGGLLAFSFWPLFMGRHCHQGIWLPLWVLLCLYLGGRFQKAGDRSARRRWACGLGLTMGLGSFTFTPWPVVALFFLAVLFWRWVVRSKGNRESFFLCAAAFLIGLIPFLLAVRSEGFGRHILSLSPWGGWFHAGEFLSNLLRHVTVFFWGAFEAEPAYALPAGGLLNPLLAVFFLWGLVQMFRFRAQALLRWTALAFLVWMLPGVLSLNLESFRFAQVLPILLFITAFGMFSALEGIPAKWQWGFLALLMLLTAAFDFNRVAALSRDPEAAPSDFGHPLKSLERYRAGQALNWAAQEWGPGLIFTDFDVPSFNDPTLAVMTYPFNRAENPALSVTRKPWMAVFVNYHYQSFLKKEFPDGLWFRLSKGLSPDNGGDLLGILPLESAGDERALRWFRAHEAFQAADRKRFLQNGGMDGVTRTLEAGYSFVKGDPFLESVYWDKRGIYAYENLDFDEHLRCAQSAVTRGYPTAELYYKWGELLLIRRKIPEAKAAFHQALQAPLNLTRAREALESLEGKPVTAPNVP